MQARPESMVQPLLIRGERLLWSARPNAGISFERSDLAGLGMGIFGALFFGTAITSGVRDGGYGFLLILVPFGIVWMSIATGQPFYRAWRRRREVYGLTDRRALILRGKNAEIESVSLARTSSIQLEMHRDGTGTILFGEQNPVNRARGNGPAFRRIDAPDRVYRLVQEAQTNTPLELESRF